MELEAVHDARGRTVARYLRTERDGLPCADLVERAEGRAVAEVVAALCAACPGWLAVTEEAGLATALRSAGAAPRRHAFVLELDLAVTAPGGHAPVPADVELVPLEAVPAGLAAVLLAAYPPGHPDFRPRTPEQTLQDLQDYVLGRGRWRRLPAGVVALRAGEPVGAAIVNRHRVPTWPEPIAWLTELFRAPDPGLRGLGAALLDAAVAASRGVSGIAAVGLSVTAGNPARRLYEGRGFRQAQESWTVLLPS